MPERTEVPAKTAFVRWPDRRFGGREAGCLGDREGLAREGGLAHVEVAGLKEHAVGGNERAGGEDDHVPGHDRIHLELRLHAISEHGDAAGDAPGEGLHRAGGAIFLREGEKAARQHDQRDDEGLAALADEGRNHGREDQDEDERAAELPREGPQGRGVVCGADRVGTEAPKPGGGFSGGEPRRRGSQCAKERVGGHRPIGAPPRCVGRVRRRQHGDSLDPMDAGDVEPGRTGMKRLGAK